MRIDECTYCGSVVGLVPKPPRDYTKSPDTYFWVEDKYALGLTFRVVRDGKHIASFCSDVRAEDYCVSKNGGLRTRLRRFAFYFVLAWKELWR